MQKTVLAFVMVGLVGVAPVMAKEAPVGEKVVAQRQHPKLNLPLARPDANRPLLRNAPVENSGNAFNWLAGGGG